MEQNLTFDKMSVKFENSFAVKSISSMYLKSEFADVHFTFPNDDQTEKIPAHKNILATVSPVFSRMFYGSLKEGDIVKIADSNASAFKQFLQLIYLSEITFTMENVEGVARLADKYDMLNSLDACIPFLESELSSENVVIVYQLAIFLENSNLKEFCEKWIRVFTKDVLKSEAFLQCEQKVIENILQFDKLECNEADLFDACIKWATMSCQRNGLDEKDPKNLKNELGNVFHLIPFGAMEEEDVKEILANKVYRDLFTYDELTDFFRMKIDKNFRSEILKHTERSKPLKTELTCHRTSRGNFVSLKRQESVWFSTNEMALLTCIHWGKLLNWSDKPATYLPDIEIIEYNTNTFTTNAPSKVLGTYRKCLIGGNCSLSLAPPITIIPRKMYEIRAADASPYRQYSDTSPKKSEIKLNDKITIKFHYDPSDIDCVRRNMVTKLTILDFDE